MKLARTILVTVLTASTLTMLIACEEIDADPITIPYSASSSGFVVDSGLTSTRVTPIQCPTHIRENSSCPQAQARCELGSNADPQCNTLYECASDLSYGNYWTIETPPSCAGTCPADPSQMAEGTPCDIPDAGAPEDELHCPTAQGICICTTGRDGAHAHDRVWVCKKTDDGCPSTRPLFGQPCIGHAECDYGSCISKRGERMICADDVWQTEVGSCPN